MKTKISVCVPYWERQAALDRMFAEYAALYPQMNIEFSVCDDGSPTPATAPPHVILTRLPRKTRALNPCVPINRAVRASSGQIIVLTNPEIEHRKPILKEMLSLLSRRSGHRYVTAVCKDIETAQWLAGRDTQYTSGGRGPVPFGGHYHFLAMMWRDVWDLTGGFDEDYREGQGYDDNDWLWRLAEQNVQFQSTTNNLVWHKRSNVRWNMPNNRSLFLQKWPEQRREKIRAHQVTYDSRIEKLVHPEWAMIIGGGETVWDDVVVWEKIYGKRWDGLVIAVNDVGCHWPRALDHWVTLHPDKLQRSWKAERARVDFPAGYRTWGRKGRETDYAIRPWAGGASGMLAIQVAYELGCIRAVLCGMPMTVSPHFTESTVHPKGKQWTAVAGHWRAWENNVDKMFGWVRSMGGRTQEVLDGKLPTVAWLHGKE